MWTLVVAFVWLGQIHTQQIHFDKQEHCQDARKHFLEDNTRLTIRWVPSVCFRTK